MTELNVRFGADFESLHDTYIDRDVYNWDQALRLGSEVTGMEYSGEYGFVPTTMYWPQTHMVAPKDRR